MLLEEEREAPSSLPTERSICMGRGVRRVVDFEILIRRNSLLIASIFQKKTCEMMSSAEKDWIWLGAGT